MAIVLQAADGVEVGTTISEVTFPNKLLTFEDVRKGLSAEASSAEISAVETVDDQNREYSTVKVTISSPPGGAIANGIVADLVFTISEDAPLEEAIELKNVAMVLTTDDPPNSVEPITGKTGEVLVTASPPIFACFFYMH